MFPSVFKSVLGVVVLLAVPASAQNRPLAELYGSGVHAYNAGEHAEAHELLTTAIDAGSQDPRAFYFRGLCYLKLGRDHEARSDFATGAELEMADTDRFFNVSKSLERVQGKPRLLVERYRSEARLLAFQERERQRFERYERIRAAEPDVLLQPPPDAASEPAAPGSEPEAGAPAGEGQPPGELPAEPEPADPFAPEPEPAEAPEADDPFRAPPEGDLEPAEGEPAVDEASASQPVPKVPPKVLGKAIGGAFLKAVKKLAAPGETGAGPPAAGAGAGPDAAAPPPADPFGIPPGDDDSDTPTSEPPGDESQSDETAADDP